MFVSIVMGPLLVCFLVCVCVYLLLKVRQNRFLPPGPFGLPVIGYLPCLDSSKPYLTLTNLSKKYGKIYSLQLGNICTIVLTDPKVIRKVLANDIFTGRADLYLTHGIMKGYGIIVADGSRWKEQRRFVLSMLKCFGMVKIGPKRAVMENRIMEGVHDTFRALDLRGSDNVDIGKILLHSMGNVINYLVFGIKWSEDHPTWIWLQYLAEQGVKQMGVAGPINFLPFLRFIPKYRKTLKFLVDGIENTHEVYKSIVFDESNNTESIAKSFIEKIKEGSEESFTETQLYYLLADLFGAGVDTTLTTMRWYLLFMSIYPSIQDKVQEELDSRIFGDIGPRLEDIPYLPYTVASLSETQRIRSLLPLGIPHSNNEETFIEGYRIPKGAMIIPLQWAVHMDEEAWDNPESFDPCRFLDENGRHVKADSFMPFQSGKRSCVGEEMAHMMLFLFGAGLLFKYRVRLAQDPDSLDISGICGITLIPPHHELIFTRRKV